MRSASLNGAGDPRSLPILGEWNRGELVSIRFGMRLCCAAERPSIGLDKVPMAVSPPRSTDNGDTVAIGRRSQGLIGGVGRLPCGPPDGEPGGPPPFSGGPRLEEREDKAPEQGGEVGTLLSHSKRERHRRCSLVVATTLLVPRLSWEMAVQRNSSIK